MHELAERDAMLAYRGTDGIPVSGEYPLDYNQDLDLAADRQLHRRAVAMMLNLVESGL